MSEEVELLRADETVTDPEHTSSEHTVVEAVLKADSTGVLGQTSVRRFSSSAHSGKMGVQAVHRRAVSRLPAFALADDGYLVLQRYGASMLQRAPNLESSRNGTRSPASAPRELLVVRYPIRTKGDLLPVKALNAFHLRWIC